MCYVEKRELLLLIMFTWTEGYNVNRNWEIAKGEAETAGMESLLNQQEHVKNISRKKRMLGTDFSTLSRTRHHGTYLEMTKYHLLKRSRWWNRTISIDIIRWLEPGTSAVSWVYNITWPCSAPLCPFHSSSAHSMLCFYIKHYFLQHDFTKGHSMLRSYIKIIFFATWFYIDLFKARCPEYVAL